MLSLEHRRNRQDFWAYLCYGTIEDSYLRVKQLLDTGRPIVHVERYLVGGDIKVTTGVHIWHEGIRPGIFFRKDDDYAQFSVTLDPVTFGFGWSGYRKEGDESEHREHYHKLYANYRDPGYVNYRRDVARIDVEGFGEGRNDHAVIRHFNSHGVGTETALYFHYEESGDRIKEETALIEALAGRDNWTAAQLCELIETAKVGGMSMIEAVEYLNKMYPKGN